MSTSPSLEHVSDLPLNQGGDTIRSAFKKVNRNDGKVSEELGKRALTTDPRFTDPRDAKAHASRHAKGGTDALTPAQIGALPEDHVYSFEDLSDVPEEFPPEEHEHSYVKTVGGVSPNAAGDVPFTSGIRSHSELEDLSEDDHPQYALADGTRGAFQPEGDYVEEGDVRLSDPRDPKVHNHNDLYYTRDQHDTFAQGKADAVHDHDAIYTRTTELNTRLGQKADNGHTHPGYATVDALDAGLSGRSPLGHTHSGYATVEELEEAAQELSQELSDGLAGKSNTGHAHEGYASSQELSEALEGKSDVDHLHPDHVRSVNNTPPDANGNITVASGPGGASDHGALDGLEDDDHPHYHTDERADARYLSKNGGTLEGNLSIRGNTGGAIGEFSNAHAQGYTGFELQDASEMWKLFFGYSNETDHVRFNANNVPIRFMQNSQERLVLRPDGTVGTTHAVNGATPQEMARLSGLSGNVQASLDAKADGDHEHSELSPIGHEHPDYITGGELTGALSGKSDFGHTHDDRYVQSVNGEGPDEDGNVTIIAEGGVASHSQLSDLGADDHPHYALADGSRGEFQAKGDYVVEGDSRLSDAREPLDHDHPGYATTGALSSGLSGKADTGHTHPDLATKAELEDYSLEGHQHPYVSEPELNLALANKADVVHDHDEIYYRMEATDVLLDEKSDTGHTHPELSPTGHTHAEYATTTNVTNALANKSDVGHAHGDLYNTKSEISSLLAGKSNSGHTHDERYPSRDEFSSALSGKAGTVHNHDDRYYTESETDTRLAGKADLGPDGKVATSQMPALREADTYTVSSQAAMLALPADKGDMAIRSDTNRVYRLVNDSPGTLANWLPLPVPVDLVQAVNGQTGIVNLVATDVGAHPSSWRPSWADVTDKPSAFTPTAHKSSHATGGTDALTPADIGAAAAGHAHALADLPVATSGESSSVKVVRADDSRLSNARGPIAHKSTHASGGADALSPADIGASPTTHSHTNASSAAAGFMSSSDKTKLDGLTNSSVPAGAIWMWGGSTAPAGWLLCNGTSVSRSEYPALFSAIGTNFGSGNGTTTFGLPDMTSRGPVGIGPHQDMTVHTLGEKFGNERHELTISEMPPHTHRFSGAPATNTTTTGTGQRVSALDAPYSSSRGTVGQGATEVTGGGSNNNAASHNNMQPSLGLNFIIKA